MSATTSLTACDAIALLLLELETGDGYLKDYYAGAFRAIVAGLQLQHPDALCALLGPNQRAVLEGQRTIQPLQLGQMEIVEFWGLVRLRRDALQLHRHHEGLMFGRPFLQDPSYRDRSYQPSLSQVVTWWKEAHETTAHGVKLLDQALCAMVNWSTADELSLKILQARFGYPDPEPVYDKWAASF